MKKRMLVRLGLLACLASAGCALYLWWCLGGVSGITRASVWRSEEDAPRVVFALTRWERLEDINFDDESLKWYEKTSR